MVFVTVLDEPKVTKRGGDYYGNGCSVVDGSPSSWTVSGSGDDGGCCRPVWYSSGLCLDGPGFLWSWSYSVTLRVPVCLSRVTTVVPLCCRPRVS